jgi:hypothetical protein
LPLRGISIRTGEELSSVRSELGGTGCEQAHNLRETEATDAPRSTNVATARIEGPLDASMAQSATGLVDPGLATIIERWPTLPEAVRLSILAMVEAAGRRG